MAWLARSIANTLLSPEEELEITDPGPSANSQPGSPTRGVREDLSELTGALANRFQGLASFLAPAAPGVGGARAPDPAEIAGRFRAGLARLPGRQAVADLAKMASALLPAELGESEPPAGVTEEVVAFARDAALRPELWLDFPLLPDAADSDDFDMTDAQQDHALAVESVAPELADLRIELCPGHMSEGCFWKIYFVLLHPKLRKEDAEILSTPQILEAREKLSSDLQYQTMLQSSKKETAAVPFSNVDATVASPIEMLGALKDQDGTVMATSFSNVDYGRPQPINEEVKSTTGVSAGGAVSSDNTSRSVPVQLVPVLENTTVFSQSTMEKRTINLSTEDAVAEEQPAQMSEIALVDNSPEEDRQKRQLADTSEQEQPAQMSEIALVDNSPPKEDRPKQQLADTSEQEQPAQMSEIALVDNSPPKEDEQKQQLVDTSEQSKVVIQKTDYDDDDSKDGDEWLEEETGGPETSKIPIVDDEDVSFSDLEEDDGAS